MGCVGISKYVVSIDTLSNMNKIKAFTNEDTNEINKIQINMNI